MARPTSYKKEYCKIAKDLCLLGHSDRQIAAELRVAESTLNIWKKQFPEFSESLAAGKIKPDIEVAKGLYKRAKGYKYRETTIEDGKKKTVIKEMPGDVNAQKFWLTNRQKENWRDKQSIGVEFEQMTDAQIDEIFNRLIKINAQ